MFVSELSFQNFCFRTLVSELWFQNFGFRTFVSELSFHNFGFRTFVSELSFQNWNWGNLRTEAGGTLLQPALGEPAPETPPRLFYERARFSTGVGGTGAGT